MQLSELGGRIRARREKLGLKQQDIANALQVSPQAVSKWERGENGPDLSILGPLARLLGVSADWLLDAHTGDLDLLDATVFASDVRGAYERSTTMEPRDFASWANGLFVQLTETVLRQDGVPVKYMGDGALCFFAGPNHQRRAVAAAFRAQQVVSAELAVGLSSGEIYLGAMGHQDYARPDIMGEAVSIAFLTLDWAGAHTSSGLAITASLAPHLDDTLEVVRTVQEDFKNIDHPVEVCELRQRESS